MIFQNPHALKTYLEDTWSLDEIQMVMTSGGFDPLHIGHLQCIQESVAIAHSRGGILVVIVNGDGFLERKKGRPFMKHQERMEIINALAGVDYVVGWDDGTQTVEGAIKILRPNVFTKGGDRSEPSAVPEWDICQLLDCEIMFGVGGDNKLQSSSDLIRGTIDDPEDFNLLSVHDDDDSWISDRTRHVDKPWGHEEILVETDKYCAKILTIDSGHRLSRQYHEKKDETIMVIQGVMALEIGDKGEYDTAFLEKGAVRRILPGTIHRFCHWQGRVKVLEISTSELDDVVRLEDDYDRS